MSTALAPAVLLAHDVGVSASPARRRFTAAYKLKIVTAADACTQPGDLAALLRREGLYSSHLAAWRAAERRGEFAGPTRHRGPTAAPVNAQTKRVADLERQLAKATARAERAEGLVALQKKVAELFGQTLDTPSEPR
jgi:transposase-like protein